MKKAIYLLFAITILVSCKKIEGPGGTSAIRGHVHGSTSNAGEAEVTQITCTSGLNLEHGDYWILNTSNSTKNYYIYYSNPTWVSSANPNLLGRTGIMVSFNYNDSNLDIALKTKTALQSIVNSNFSVTISSDVLTITDGGQINVVDADNGTTSFAVDVVNNGKPGTSTNEIAMANERVYIIYGDNAFPSQDLRTDETGAFSFEGLQVGNYTIYVLSKISANSDVYERVEQKVSITEKESISNVATFDIIY